MENNPHFIWAQKAVFLKKVPEESILYCRAEKNKVIVYLNSDPGQIRTTRSLNELESMLSKENFFRCNRWFIVNINSIDQISPKLGHIILTNGLEVAISRKRKEELCRRLNTCYHI